MKKSDPESRIKELELELSNLKSSIKATKHIEKALSESEAKHNAMITNISDVIGIIGADGLMKYKSSNIENHFGWKPKDLIGTDGFSNVHPDDLERIQKKFFAVLEKENSSVTVEYRYKCKDGSYKPIELTAKNLVSDDAINGVLLNYHDISDRKQAETELKKFKTISEQAEHGNAIADLKGNLVYINKAFAEVHGYEPDELLGKNLSVFHTKTQMSRVDQLNKGLEINGRFGHEEVWHVHRNGTEFPMLMSAVLMTDEHDKPQFLAASVIDITERKQSEEQIREEKKVAESYLSIAKVMFATIDTKEIITMMNKKGHDILGYEDGELVGKNWFEALLPKRIKDEVREVYHRLLAGDTEPVEFYENLLLTKDGEERIIAFHNTIIREDNRINGVLLSAEDITERKQTEEELQEQYQEYASLNEEYKSQNEDLIIAKEKVEENELKYRSMFTSMQEGVYLHEVIYDNQGNAKNYRITDANPLSEKVLNINSEDAIGKTATELFGTDEAPFLGIYAKVAETGEPVSFEQYFEPMDKHFYISVFSPKKGEFATAFLDITQNKNYEKDLIAAKEKAEESDRLKSAFLANMSHEIRTPMNGILGFAELLKKPDLSGEKQQKYIEIMGQSGKRMLDTINGIVDISKIEAGLVSIYFSESNVNTQTESLHEFFKPMAESKGLQLSLSNGLSSNEAVINTDKQKFNSVLTNLVNNAFKFTTKGSIEFGYVKKGESLEFFVKDTGIGIPKDRLDAIFERFIMADIEDKQAFQGSGLGLAISKSYVEMLGGEIWVESQEGRGTTFYFTIPLTIESKDNAIIDNTVSEKDKEVETNPEISGLKILVAEDHEVSYSLLTYALDEISSEVIHAETGKEAVNACYNNPDIDLVLMDIRMPEMGGYEATAKIRQFNKDIVIIAQTAYGLSGDREKAIEAGCNDYISKPVELDILTELIKKHCNK